MINLGRVQITFLITLGILFSSSAGASLGGWLYETNRAMEAWLASLEEREETIADHQWLYYVKTNRNENNLKQTHENCTVLLHGFTAEASHWFRFARHLKSECIIVPDLPAFGRSSYLTSSDYSSQEQAKRLKQFLDQLTLSKHYDIVGSSMGGHIAAIFTLLFPAQVNTLTLFNAGGVNSPKLSELDLKVQKTGKSLFEVENLEEFRLMLDTTMSDPPWMPGLVRNHIGTKAIERTERYREIFKATYKQDFLDQQLQSIKAPTLIIWGEEDKLLHPIMANVFHKGISNSQKTMMPNIGHLPFLEQPKHSASIFQDFIDIQGSEQ